MGSNNNDDDDDVNLRPRSFPNDNRKNRRPSTSRRCQQQQETVLSVSRVEDGSNDCDFTSIGCSPIVQTKSPKRQSYVDSSTVDDGWMIKNLSTSPDKDDSYSDEFNPLSSSNVSSSRRSGGPSLAKMDSLALKEELDVDDDLTATLDDSLIVEHMLPDYSGRRRRRRLWLWLAACCVMSAVVVLTAVVAVRLGTNTTDTRNINVNDGSESSSLSDNNNIFATTDPPILYYLLEPKVVNASALLDPTTAEGKAFQATAESERSISYNDASDTSAIELDVIQRYALMTLYFGSDGTLWDVQDGWSGNAGDDVDDDVCTTWYGVTCRNSVVTGINLSGNGLKGSIPPDFCLLNFLQVIALSESANIALPPCTAQLPDLEELYLDGNNFQGPLSDIFHTFPSLTYLNLSNNSFTGSLHNLFPPNVNDGGGSYSKLKTLLLNDNNLSGVIPQSNLRRLRTLERLEIMGNPNLTGSLNEICKGSLMFAEADCERVSCRCCQRGTSCPSF